MLRNPIKYLKEHLNKCGVTHCKKHITKQGAHQSMQRNQSKQFLKELIKYGLISAGTGDVKINNWKPCPLPLTSNIS
jgi:hypothetical protein